MSGDARHFQGVENEGKCHLKVHRVRHRGLLIFQCDVEGHYHGEPHHIIKSIREEDLAVDAEELYKEMVKS